MVGIGLSGGRGGDSGHAWKAASRARGGACAISKMTAGAIAAKKASDLLAAFEPRKTDGPTERAPE